MAMTCIGALSATAQARRGPVGRRPNVEKAASAAEERHDLLDQHVERLALDGRVQAREVAAEHERALGRRASGHRPGCRPRPARAVPAITRDRRAASAAASIAGGRRRSIDPRAAPMSSYFQVM